MDWESISVSLPVKTDDVGPGNVLSPRTVFS